MEERVINQEIKDIVSWLSGYVLVMKEHPRLKEEVKKLRDLVLRTTHKKGYQKEEQEDESRRSD